MRPVAYAYDLYLSSGICMCLCMYKHFWGYFFGHPAYTAGKYHIFCMCFVQEH